jgi:hypothetical protein
MTETPIDNTMIMRVLQNVQASLARLELKVEDMDDKIARALDEQYTHRGQLGAVRHYTDILAGRYRDLEVRVRALEEPP